MATAAANAQYTLELINDARLNPLDDAARYIASYAPLTSPIGEIQQALAYFHVDGAALLAALQAEPSLQPLAINASLVSTASSHNQAMLAANQQTHQAPGEPDLGARLSNAGYHFTTGAENVYAYANDPLYAQAGFIVDWGGSAATGGMQSPPGHRQDIYNAALREIGVAWLPDTTAGSSLGPNLVAEDFGSQGTSGAFVRGVAYADLDGNGFYTPGEGTAGLSVSVGGTSVTTDDTGGYTLATALTGTRTVTLTGAGLAAAVTAQVALTDAGGQGTNVKLDVINGTELHVSASAVVNGAVTKIVELGTAALALASTDGTGRTVIGNDGGDTLTGGSGNDTITGGAGNDTIDGGLGTNVLDGGGGSNTVVFAFASTSATVQRAGAATIVRGPGTTDTVSRFSQYRFTDTTLSALSATAPASADFSGVGRSGILFQNVDGTADAWLMNTVARHGPPRWSMPKRIAPYACFMPIQRGYDL